MRRLDPADTPSHSSTLPSGGSAANAPDDGAAAAPASSESHHAGHHQHHHHHTRSNSFSDASSQHALSASSLASAFALPYGAAGDHLRDASDADMERMLAFARETSGGAVATADAVRRLRERAVVAEVQVRTVT